MKFIIETERGIPEAGEWYMDEDLGYAVPASRDLEWDEREIVVSVKPLTGRDPSLRYDLVKRLPKEGEYYVWTDSSGFVEMRCAGQDHTLTDKYVLVVKP